MFTSGEQPRASGTASSKSTGRESLSEAEAASAETIRSALAGHKTIGRVLPFFVNDLPAQVASLSTLLTEGKLDAARRIVHGLKGCGGGYGFPDITRLATEAERLFDEKAELAVVLAAVGKLSALIRRVEGYEPSRERLAA